MLSQWDGRFSVSSELREGILLGHIARCLMADLHGLCEEKDGLLSCVLDMTT